MKDEKNSLSLSDSVNHPSHYTSLPATCESCGEPIECIHVTQHQNFNTGNAMKYLWRAGHKGDAIEDLEKAIRYIQYEIKRIQKERAKTAKL